MTKIDQYLYNKNNKVFDSVVNYSNNNHARWNIGLLGNHKKCSLIGKYYNAILSRINQENKELRSK